MPPVVVETSGWVLTADDPLTVGVTLTYDPADPLAVTVQVSGGAHHSWVFARDLLAEGLRSMVPVGEGRVRVQATSVLTEIRYHHAPDDPVVLRLPWWSSREFLRLALAAVPRGVERCDVDAWVAALTRSRET